MADIQVISDMINKNTISYNRFLNEYLSFLIEFVKRFDEKIYIVNPDLKDKAEKFIALTLMDLGQYQTGHTSTKALYNHYFKNTFLLGSSTSSLKIELSSLIKVMYSNNYWKEIALDALSIHQQHYPRIYFDFSNVQKSRPWFSPHVMNRRSVFKHEQVD